MTCLQDRNNGWCTLLHKKSSLKRCSRVVIPLLLMLLASFAQPASLEMRTDSFPAVSSVNKLLENAFTPSSASGEGEEQVSTAYMSRTIGSQQVSILNSYTSPDTHEMLLDLSEYLESGWLLYKVEIDAQSVTAAPEREVVGVASIPGQDFRIEEYIPNFYYTQLANGFYNKPHNGSLLNYSLSYSTEYYNTALRGTSYLVISDDYRDSSGGLTTPEAMSPHDSAFAWTTVDGENINLTQNTVYYTVINGTDLHEDTISYDYPIIYWGVESAAGSYATRIYSTEILDWFSVSYEALLNYTYIPWDIDTNSAQVYSTTSDVSLECNSTAFVNDAWNSATFAQNISAITLSANQSVDLDYSITLWYSRNEEGTTDWEVDASGGQVEWNSSISVTYPSLSGQIKRYLNFTIPADWTVSGLYNATNPSLNHSQYSRAGDVVICSNVGTESWVLSSIAPNYVSNVALYDSSDDSAVVHSANVGTVLDVNTTVESPTLDAATTGSVNLTVIHSGVTAYAPANATVTAGLGHHSWNTGTDHDENGIHTVAVFWSNGTEAGYRTLDVVIVYPTELTSVSTIDAFTDSTFSFSVFFRDSYTPQYLDGAFAEVTYSFAGGNNITMTDHANGTWSGIIDTTGRSPETYDLVIYGEGFAFENVSRVIKVTLIHDTQALDFSWSNGPNITYVESSELIVVYRRTNGNNVTNAQVNATIGIKTWNLTQQLDGSYRIRFNGSDNPPGFGSHNITINAWKSGYEPQSGYPQNLTIDREGTSLEVSWSNTNNITYLDSTILSVKYLSNSTSTEIQDAELNVTIGLTTWNLTWNSGSKAYEIQFNGTDASTGLGTHYLLIQATLYGYDDASDSSINLTIREEPTTIVLYWSAPYLNNITYIQQTTLYANFTILDNTPIQLSTVNVTFGTTTLNLNWDIGLQRYWIVFNGTDNPPEFGNHSLSVQAWKHGFQGNSDTTSIVIRRDPTTLTTDWPDGSTIRYVNRTTLVVHYRMSNSTDIENAMVNVTISGETWDMTWDGFDSAYKLTFNGTDSPFLGTHALTISAWKYGFIESVDTSQTLVIEEEPTHLTYSWLPADNITYFEYTYFFVYYRMSNSSIIPGATLNVTIGSDSWDLLWNSTQQAYGIRFNGSDAIPGLGTHPLNVTASAYGFESAINWSQSLIITLEGTDLSASWTAPNFNSITYLEYTELQVFYEMNNGTSILDAIVNVTIGTKTWNLTWSGAYYTIIFNGTDIELGFGLHSLIIKAGKAHFQNKQNVGQTLTIDYEPTTISSTVEEGFITYVEETQLIVTYALTNTTPIIGATVNVTIIDETWDLWWNSTDGTYRIRFNGSDDPPGLAAHTLIISAWKYGYENRSDTQTLVIAPEPTSIVISWSPSDTITYLQSTIMQVDYRMSNLTSISEANVVVYIGIHSWPVRWNASSGFHEIIFNGTDPIPGVGTYAITVQASKLGFAGNSNGTQSLTIDPESSQLILTWESTHDNIITFVEYTTLYANYTMLDGTPLTDATVNVSISILGQYWDLHWNPGLELYEIRFNGTDNPPEFGIHFLTVSAWKYGYEVQEDSSEILIIDEESTYLFITWSNGASITYLQKTTLRINYTMSNGTTIPDAYVVVDIGSHSWNLSWTGSIYEITFNGTDLIPGLGSHSVNISASKYGYDDGFRYGDTLVIAAEPTNALLSWEITYGNNITFLESTTLYVSYTFPNGTAITDATVNVTISGLHWNLTYNGLLESYEVTFDGTDDPPGFGSHTLNISAWKFGYGEQTPSTSLAIRLEPTTITPSWDYEEFEYHNSTTLSFEYRDSHGTLIDTATQKEVWVNSTLGTLLGTTGIYRIILDKRFDLGFHTVVVNISKYGYEPAYLDIVSFTILIAST
ncbi:MAG: hypothetical protein ACFFCR_05745, partial [Promethearchaeota archaeon]